MKAVLARVIGGGAMCAALCGLPARAPAATLVEQARDAEFDVEASAAARATFAACSQMVGVLSQHGWDVSGYRVRVQANPFDATAPAADLVIGAGQPGDSAAFTLASAVIERQLARSAPPQVARTLAQLTAAHLSPPGSARRVAWEGAWRARLGRGDVLSTALPELLWRTGGDAAIRRSARTSWPASALDVLAALGVEDATRAIGEVAVAGLLDPSALGFQRSSFPELAESATQTDPEVHFPEAGLKVVALSDEAGAVAVLPLQADRAEGWVAVRYALTGTYDVVPLDARAEVTVPLRGVAWAGVIAVAGGSDASLSLAVRPVPDYPVQIRRWDFLATERSVTLSWETQRETGLQAFVVEALAESAGGAWTVVRRTILPAAAQGERPFAYAFVDEEHAGVTAYRLLALTADGFLAEVGSFPVREKP
jgi:hypothetical protein